MRVSALARVLCAVPLVLAGCGGNNGPSASAYRDQAEAICVAATGDAAAVPPPTDSAKSVAAYSTIVGKIREREAVALSKLEAPGELQKSHTLLVDASGAIVRSLTDLARAAERGDRTAAEAASAGGARAAAQARRAADELELPSCGKPGTAR